MIYLKTIISSPNEIKFIKLNLREAYQHIDKMIICEFNYTHTGLKRDFIFKKYKQMFTKDELSKITYLGVDISKTIKSAFNNEVLAHENERLMRGHFIKEMPINKDDIVFSVDADEIIFSEHYQPLINKLKESIYFWQKKSYRLPMRQFFYKVNYLWENHSFNSAVACKASFFLKKSFPAQWRDRGVLYEKIVGNHYSWCIPVEDMVEKIKNYAHQEQFSHLAKKEIMQKSIDKKKYPFDEDRDFRIKVINSEIDKEKFPKSLLADKTLFKELFGE